MQSTSIPGVAQRTGATNYYVELFPKHGARSNALPPVLGLTPVPGDVEIVIASELMEAGRAVQRGIGDDARLVMVVHECLESHFAAAVEEIGRLDDVRSQPRFIRVIEEEFV